MPASPASPPVAFPRPASAARVMTAWVMTAWVMTAWVMTAAAAGATDWAAVPTLDAAPPDGPWAVAPATLAAAGAPLAPEVVVLPNRESFFEKFGGIAADPAGATALVGYTLAPPGARGGTTRLAAVDLTRGRAVRRATAEGLWVPLAVDAAPGGGPAGDPRALVRSADFGIGKAARLEVWSVGRRDVTRGRSWVPYESAGGRFDDDVAWAALAGGRAVTLSDEGNLAAWDLIAGGPSAAGAPPALWTLDLGRGEQTPALSPSGMHLAALAGGAVVLIDLAGGETVAAIPGIDGYFFPRLAFARDGSRLALLNANALRVWTLADGALDTAAVLPEAPGWSGAPGAVGGGAMDWVGPRCVLIGGELLVDVESRLPLWRYRAQAPPAVAGGVAWFPLAETGAGKRAALAGYGLPHAAAAAALEKARTDPDFLVLEAGDGVRVDVSAVPADGRDRARAGLEKAVTGGGYVLDPAADAVLTGSVQRTDPRTMRYARFGMSLFEKGETVTVRDHRFVLGLTVGGAEVWRTGLVQSTAPYEIVLKRGQSAADAVRQFDVPDYGTFGGTTLPAPVLRPSRGVTSLGESEVTNEGFRPFTGNTGRNR